MKKYIRYIFLLGLGFLLFKIFLPESYEVPAVPAKSNLKHWKLTTGSEISYTVIPAQGHPQLHQVIYLHDGPGGYVSEKTIAILGKLAEDGYDVYFYDQIGSGHSARLQDIKQYTAQRHKKDLEAIVNIVGHSQVILVGEGWGSSLATLYAAEHPTKIDRLILSNPASIIPENTTLTPINPPDSLKLKGNQERVSPFFSLRTMGIEFLANTFGMKLAKDSEIDNHETFRQRQEEKFEVCNPEKALTEIGTAGGYVALRTKKSLLTTKDPRPALKNLKIPVLVLKGQCDNIAWGFTNEYLKSFANAKLQLIPEAGHDLTAEQPELYFKAVRDFLR